MTPIYQNEHFHVEAVQSPAIAGYLIVRPNVPVTALSDLLGDTLAALGPLLAAGMSAIQKAVAPERIYVIRLGEDVQEIHFHLFPRSRAMMELYTRLYPGHASPSGAFLFDWARKPEIVSQLYEKTNVQEAARIIEELLS